MNNSKYSQEMREETAKFIFENGRYATSVAEEANIRVKDIKKTWKIQESDPV